MISFDEIEDDPYFIDLFIEGLSIFYSQVMKDGNGHISSVIPIGLKIEIDPENDDPVVTTFDVKVIQSLNCYSRYLAYYTVKK